MSTPRAGSPSATRSELLSTPLVISEHAPDEPVPDPGGGLVRVRLDVGYDGTRFSGWARQPGRRTVLDELERGLATVLRVDVDLTVAGRTDAGVHAIGQVAHLDVPTAVFRDHQARLLRRLRGVLPPDIAVTAAREVPADFDARFSGLARHYLYRISDADSGPPVLRRADTVGWPRRLDDRAMGIAAGLLLGRQDFAAYCRRREFATTIRTLLALDVVRDGDVVEIRASADAFCHSMVRSLVGALTAVGEGRRLPEWPGSLLARTSRAQDVPVAPPGGLTLVAVDYPPEDQLAARNLKTRALRTSVTGDP